jgi:hypothetical protein
MVPQKQNLLVFKRPQQPSCALTCRMRLVRDLESAAAAAITGSQGCVE